MDNRTIGLRVAQLRREREMSCTELARRAGLSQPQISRLENGKQGFRSATLDRIAAALEVPPAYFFEEESEAVREATRARTRTRRKLGRETADDLEDCFGRLVVTPGYRRLVRRMTAELARDGCDARTLRRLIDKVLTMKDDERANLLDRLRKE
jgi:transcriptional regulator with XRE-family HTH domain